MHIEYKSCGSELWLRIGPPSRIFWYDFSNVHVWNNLEIKFCSPTRIFRYIFPKLRGVQIVCIHPTTSIWSSTLDVPTQFSERTESTSYDSKFVFQVGFSGRIFQMYTEKKSCRSKLGLRIGFSGTIFQVTRCTSRLGQFWK